MNTFKSISGLFAIIISLFLSASLYSASLVLSTSQPTVSTDDIANLVGAAADRDNVGSAASDGGNNDGTTYIAFDRPAQGQTFVTPPSALAYTLNAITIRHTGYTANTVDTWYRMSANNAFTIRVTNPAVDGTSAFVLGSETYTLSGSEDNIFSVNTASSSLNGTGTWFTFYLDTPVELAPGTLYGFDLGTQQSFFELHGIKDSAESGNPYLHGSAYTSGSGGSGNNSFSTAPGDRVFIIHLTADSPADGDLNFNGKVDLHDVAVLADYFDSALHMPTLEDIASNWLETTPPVFDNDPLIETDALIDIRLPVIYLTMLLITMFPL